LSYATSQRWRSIVAVLSFANGLSSRDSLPFPISGQVCPQRFSCRRRAGHPQIPASGVGGVHPWPRNMQRPRHLLDSHRGRGAAGGGALPRFATERMFLKHGQWKGRARPPAEPSDPSGKESGISTRPPPAPPWMMMKEAL